MAATCAIASWTEVASSRPRKAARALRSLVLMSSPEAGTGVPTRSSADLRRRRPDDPGLGADTATSVAARSTIRLRDRRRHKRRRPDAPPAARHAGWARSGARHRDAPFDGARAGRTCTDAARVRPTVLCRDASERRYRTGRR